MKHWVLFSIIVLILVAGCIETGLRQKGQVCEQVGECDLGLICEDQVCVSEASWKLPWCDVSQGEYDELRNQYDVVARDNSQLTTEVNDLEYRLWSAAEPPYITIKGRNVTFAFKLLNGDDHTWTFPFETYESSYNDGYLYRESGPKNLETFIERKQFEDELCGLEANLKVAWCNYAVAYGAPDDCNEERKDRTADCNKWSASSLETYNYMKRTQTVPKMPITIAGETYQYQNFTQFVQRWMFEDVMQSLYEEVEYDDEQLVKEAYNIVQQITEYVPELKETPRYPIETLTGAGGDCEDSAILMASMVGAVNEDWEVKLIYLDINNPTEPVEVNHVIVWVNTGEYSTFVETTAKGEFYNAYPQGVNGWELVV